MSIAPAIKAYFFMSLPPFFIRTPLGLVLSDDINQPDVLVFTGSSLRHRNAGAFMAPALFLKWQQPTGALP